MAIASLVSSASIQAMSPAATLTDVSTDALGDAIAALAARLHAATYELLILLREFDSRTDWHGGFASCAHWLHWRTGIALGPRARKSASPTRWRRFRSSAPRWPAGPSPTPRFGR